MTGRGITAQHSTAEYSTAQHSTAEYCTAQHSLLTYQIIDVMLPFTVQKTIHGLEILYDSLILLLLHLLKSNY